jgi:hypothetical protein
MVFSIKSLATFALPFMAFTAAQRTIPGTPVPPKDVKATVQLYSGSGCAGEGLLGPGINETISRGTCPTVCQAPAAFGSIGLTSNDFNILPACSFYTDEHCKNIITTQNAGIFTREEYGCTDIDTDITLIIRSFDCKFDC